MASVSDTKFGPREEDRTRKAFDTVDIEGEKVDLIRSDGVHSTCDNNCYARYSSGELHGFNGHRIRWGVEIKEGNYLKESHLSGSEVRKSCTAKIFAGDVQVYELGGRDVEIMLDKVKWTIAKLEDLPAEVFTREGRIQITGRRIFYRDQSAIIENYFVDQGTVIIAKAGTGHFNRAAWQDEDNDEYESTVKEDILSPHIWWFGDK